MPQLLVRKLEPRVLQKLRQKAAAAGISMEEEHRRILRRVLLGTDSKEMNFKEYLTGMPDVGSDTIFARQPAKVRKVRL